MKKICLAVAGIFLLFFGASAQTDSAYKSRKLKLEEANFISSYYHQEGNNAAVTGGVGSERLSDFANVIDVKLTKYDRKNRLHTFTAECGVDTYTSASSDMIDLHANSSASSSDVRIYPSVSWSVTDDHRGTTFGLNASSSTEYDYQSFGGGISFSKKSKDQNREFSAKAQVYLDQVSLIAPKELRNNSGYGERDDDDYSTTPRNSFSGSFSYSQVVNKRLQFLLLLDLVYQHGYLGLPFHRVYLNSGTVVQEKLPGDRFKLPIGIRANYFLGDKVVLRSFYRFYHDDWGLTAHTAELETVFKLTNFISLSPFYRFNHQSGVDYFAPYKKHLISDAYFTSNYDLSRFDSHFAGTGIRLSPPHGIFGIKHLSMIEIRYGHYMRSTNLNSNIISLNLRYK